MNRGVFGQVDTKVAKSPVHEQTDSLTMNEDHDTTTLTLRPLPGSPWLTQHAALGYSVLDLRGLLPEGSRIVEVALNGKAMMFKPASLMTVEHHLISVPLLRLEADRLTIHTAPARPSGALRSPERGRGDTKVATRPIEAPRGPDLRQGLLPAGARV